jgi:hypothetical protein
MSYLSAKTGSGLDGLCCVVPPPLTDLRGNFGAVLSGKGPPPSVF